LSIHPVIGESGLAALLAGSPRPDAEHDSAAAVQACPDLAERFAGVHDGRQDRGRAHPVAVVLALCAGAVVAGMRSFTAIAGWVVDVPAELLARLYDRPSHDPPRAPSTATIWRVLTGADAAEVDAVIGAWLLDQAAGAPGQHPGGAVAIAVDGKTVRVRHEVACGEWITAEEVPSMVT
jgi:hypothetical protein